jgi:hypothetical protein
MATIGDAVVTIEHRKAPHGLYLTLGLIAVLILAGGVGFAIWELIQIERNVNKSAAASAETLAMVNQALKGTHQNGDDGLLVLSRLFLQNGVSAANALKQTMQDANKIAKANEPKTVALADASITLVNTAAGTVSKLSGAADQLSGVIAKVDSDTIPKVNASVDSLNGLLSDLRPTAQASTVLVTEAADTVKELKVSVTTANALLADPELAGIVHNLNTTSANASVVAGNLGLVTMDVHNMLNPKKTTFWEALATTAAKSVLGAAAGPLVSHFFPVGVNISNAPVPVSVVPKP